MRVLIIGGGAREHALVWKLAGERGVGEIICAPGNPGIARLARCVPVNTADPEALLALAVREQVDFTVVGPEQPLAAGVVDRFAADNRLAFGPTQLAAELESSKVFAKTFMARHGIPTATFRICADRDAALRILDAGDLGLPVVVKADGLAAGKGVVVAADRDAAVAAVDAALVERRFGPAGERLVLEECLSGQELSFFAVCDGRRAQPLGSAQDHKRVFDDDRGPNTGGMGAFAPSPSVTPELQARILAEIVRPALRGLHHEGREYRGFLYAGLILTTDGPKVIEFNVRMGDPEAQVVLPGLQMDLLPLLLVAARGALVPQTPTEPPAPHVGVVLASGGYPGPYQKGKPIEGLDHLTGDPNLFVFHAGTALVDGRLVTDGGRVLTVVARAETFGAARDRAYGAVRQVSFEGMHYRTDIGRRALPVGA